MRKRRNSDGREQHAAGSSGKAPRPAWSRPGWLLIVGAICCAPAVGLSAATLFRPGGERAKERAIAEGPEESPRASQVPVAPEESASKPPATPPEQTPAPSEPASTPQNEAEALKNEIIEVADRLLKDFPDAAAPLLLMGNVLATFGDTVQAKQYCRKCLERDPLRAEAYNSLGVAALLGGQFEEAVSMWTKALEINPRMLGVREPLARALLNLGRTQEAVAVLEQGIGNSPESSSRHFLLGQGYLQLQDYQKAKKSYEAAIQIQPGYTLAYYGLATACTRLGERGKAKEYGEKFRELKGSDVDTLRGERRDPLDDLNGVRRQVIHAYVEAAGMYRAAGYVWRAEKLLQRATTVDPKDTESRWELASLYQQNRRNEEALQMYEELRHIDPQNAKYAMYSGMLCAQMERLDAAEAAFGKVVELAPERSWGYQGLAQLYLRTNRRLSEAKAHAETAARLDPVASNYYILGEACKKTGDSAGALAALQRAVQLEPGNPKYQREYELLRQGN